MSTKANRELVRLIFEELAAGKHGALLSRTAEDSQWTVTGSSPVSRKYASRQDFYAGALRSVTSRLVARVKPSVRAIYGDGDTVIVEWRGEGRARSGLPYCNEYCWVLKVREGLIREGIIYSDTALITELFRASP